MKRSVTILVLAAVVGVLTAGRLSADLYSGTIPFVNSSVDVTFTGTLTGFETITVDQGEVSLELVGAAGVYSELTLTSGTFDLVDTTMSLDQSGIPRTLQVTGFGFDLLNSVLSLTPTVGDTYEIAGDINVLANRGTLLEPSTGELYDFTSNPESATAALLNTSTITISDTDPNDDLVDVTADLRFDSQQLAAYDVAGIVVGTIDISSLNTLSPQGGLTQIPEPGSAGLLLLGLLALRTVTRSPRRFTEELRRES